MAIRKGAFLPLVLSIASFTLTVLVLLSGTKLGLLEDAYLVKVSNH
jgi:hypothetical protein